MSFDKSKLKSAVKNITLASPSSFFGEEEEQITTLPLESLRPFENHPFKVLDDQNMHLLKESIQENGVLMPIVVREKGQGLYEIVAGHRRTRASQLLGLKEIPALVRDISHEDAIFQMVDTNIQRDTILPSEKAFAYKMKLEAAKQKVGRKSKGDKNANAVPSGQASPEEGKGEKSLTSRELLAQNTPDSSVQIQRYIRLTHLIHDLLVFADEKKIPFQVAVELSYLTEEEQEELFYLLPSDKISLSLQQASTLKTMSQEGKLTTKSLIAFLQEKQPKEPTVSLKMNIASYFPEKTKKADMEKVILELLEDWKKNQS